MLKVKKSATGLEYAYYHRLTECVIMHAREQILRFFEPILLRKNLQCFDYICCLRGVLLL